jgi:transposase InsO family protein
MPLPTSRVPTPKLFRRIAEGQDLFRQLDLIGRIRTLDTLISHNVKALLDSGCTTSCIDADFVAKNALIALPLRFPFPAKNADGSTNSAGRITHYVEVEFLLHDTKGNPHSEVLELPIVNLGKSHMFLGHDWLTKHNPEIDWASHTIIMSRCPKECSTKSSNIPQEADCDVDWEGGETLLHVEVDDPYFDAKHHPHIRAFGTISTQLAAEEYQANKPSAEVPRQYGEFADVFSEAKFDELPPRRPYDHAIELKPGSSETLNAKVYPLSREEQKQLDVFLDENLKTGRIRLSKSTMASSFFFVKKKDGKLRPVQDYRRLNDLTIKNRYPLPLMKDMLNRLQGAKYFTKLDVRWGFNNVRIKEGDEWKAAFRTNRGLFEPTVMFFGLTNSPPTFQAMMDHIFGDLIRAGKMQVYLDDCLLFAPTLQELRETTREVLERCRQNKLYFKAEKCSFEKAEVDFMGVVISHKSIKMDPIKTKAIDQWPAPTNLREARSFMQFCNFYRDFIPHFSTVVKPLNVLTEKNHVFEWKEPQQRAFDLLKSAIRSDVVLMIPQEGHSFRLESDASDYAAGAVLHQIIDGVARPIGFFSKTFVEAERNYMIYDKELLAIMLALDHWRHHLMGLNGFEIWTDHKNLEYFKTAQKVNRRQARWFTTLQDYDFTLHYRPGKANKIADFLTRGSHFDKGDKDNENVVLLKPEIFRRFTVESEGDIVEEIRRKSQLRDELVKKRLLHGHPDFRENGLLVEYRGLVYVPMDKSLRERIIAAHHDSILGGHAGRAKTIELIQRTYWWPSMTGQVGRYVAGCEACQRTKPRVGAPHATLQPNEIPPHPWHTISVDFIGPLCSAGGFDTIAVIVDRSTKQVIIEPTNKEINPEGTARILRNRVFSQHGIPKKIISDRGKQFVGDFSRDLYRQLGITGNPSTAYHPQTDGQTERANQEIEKYLRLFINYHQDDWHDWLPMAEFALNNRRNDATGYSPFFLNKGYHPNMHINRPHVFQDESAEAFATRLAKNIEDSNAALKLAAEAMQRDAARRTRPSRSYEEGQRVWVEGTNIKSQRPSPKLDDKRFGPFKIVKKVGASSYKLDIPKNWSTIHPVFHESLLSPFVEPATSIQMKPPPPPPVEKDDEAPEYEVDQILRSRRWGSGYQWRIRWKGYGPQHDTWEPPWSLTNVKRKVKDFYKSDPRAPGAELFDAKGAYIGRISTPPRPRPLLLTTGVDHSLPSPDELFRLHPPSGIVSPYSTLTGGICREKLRHSDSASPLPVRAEPRDTPSPPRPALSGRILWRP